MAGQTSIFSIVFEDEDILVVDKPAGLLAVPIPGGAVKNLLDLAVAGYEGTSVEINSVHRIDRYTSGLMVFSKNGYAHAHLFNQFKNHTPERCYLAVVRGYPADGTGELNHYLKLINDGFRNIVVDHDEEGATPARLTYRVKERFLNASLIEVWLDTGLKNQIRVQFEAIGHQLVGDQHYAPEEIDEPLISRQALHAHRLSFIHPSSGEKVSFTASLPADMLRLIDHLRWERELRGVL
jgi:23S rRNA pseudouridine1911/1915/1917 synthase